MESTSSLRERFWKAVRALGTASGSLQKRVELAASILQPLRSSDAEELPEEWRPRFENLIQLHTRKITPRNAKKWAEEFFDFYSKLRGGY